MEKTLDLKLPGVTGLGREEMKEVEGGWVGAAVFAAAVMLGAMINDAQNNPDDYNSAREKARNFFDGR